MPKLKVEIHPLDWSEDLLDLIMVPVMYIAAGTLRESPQRTHYWNNMKLQPLDTALLSKDKMAHCEADPSAITKKGRIRFHIPIFGGWKKYVVIEPTCFTGVWHVGWITSSVRGVSRIPLVGQVRLLLGPENVSFFGIEAPSHEQIHICHVGNGRVGDGGPYARVPLL